MTPQGSGNHPSAGSFFCTGLKMRCPRCGQGRLFKGFLTFRPACDVCDLDFSGQDTGDGPAALIILLVGALVMPAALFVEVSYQPAYWIHAVLWLPLIVLLPLLLLRPLKAIMFALQFKHTDLPADKS